MPQTRANSPIRFFFQSDPFTLENRSRLKAFIKTIFRKEGFKLDSLNYIFCSDQSLLEINRQYLNHDYYTDIITFDLSESNALNAEIYISIDRVRDNARTLGVSFKAELLRVMFHGALHLCGYSDKKASQQKQMRAREDHYLKLYR